MVTQNKDVKISIIAAMADNRVIGMHNKLPWRIPADMKWFRQHTLGKPIVMGRKTFESLGAKALPDRRNIVITRDAAYHGDDAVIVHTIDEAIALAGDADEIMIIGGASFYEQMLPYAQRMYLTYVHAQFEGDAWFPQFDVQDWREVQRHDHCADEKNPWDYSFVILNRK